MKRNELRQRFHAQGLSRLGDGCFASTRYDLRDHRRDGADGQRVELRCRPISVADRHSGLFACGADAAGGRMEQPSARRPQDFRGSAVSGAEEDLATGLRLDQLSRRHHRLPAAGPGAGCGGCGTGVSLDRARPFR